VSGLRRAAGRRGSEPAAPATPPRDAPLTRAAPVVAHADGAAAVAGGPPEVARRGVGDVVVAAEGMVQAGGLGAGGRAAHHAVGAARLVDDAGVGAGAHHAGAGLCGGAHAARLSLAGRGDPRTATLPPQLPGFVPGKPSADPVPEWGRGLGGSQAPPSPLLPRTGTGRGRRPGCEGPHGPGQSRTTCRELASGCEPQRVELSPARRGGTRLRRAAPRRCLGRGAGLAAATPHAPGTGDRQGHPSEGVRGAAGARGDRIGPCAELCWAGAERGAQAPPPIPQQTLGVCAAGRTPAPPPRHSPTAAAGARRDPQRSPGTVTGRPPPARSLPHGRGFGSRSPQLTFLASHFPAQSRA